MAPLEKITKTYTFYDFGKDINRKSLPFHHISTALLDIFSIAHNRYWWSPQCHNKNPFPCVCCLKWWLPCCCLSMSAVDAVFLLLKLAGVLSLWKGFTLPLSLTCTQHQSSHSLSHWSCLYPCSPWPELRNKRRSPSDRQTLATKWLWPLKTCETDISLVAVSEILFCI